ncbi:hypothetical protein EDC04DRAFT_2609150 [Pisolithus marmoratus]|nr:hypothetical protein EDC04DRAFT_2609150 [Pisolithus marmoratus]
MPCQATLPIKVSHGFAQFKIACPIYEKHKLKCKIYFKGTWGTWGKAPNLGGEPAGARALLVHWDQDPTRTEWLIHWLLSHAANHNVLFHNKNYGESSSAPPPTPDDKPSG